MEHIYSAIQGKNRLILLMSKMSYPFEMPNTDHLDDDYPDSFQDNFSSSFCPFYYGDIKLISNIKRNVAVIAREI